MDEDTVGDGGGDRGETISISHQEDKIYTEIFSSLDNYRRNWIPAAQIAYALRIHGQVPTEKDISEIIQNAVDEERPEEEPRLSYDDFKVIMKQYSKTKDQLYHQIDEAFMIFDQKELGLIDEADIRKALATLGEVLEETEINEFVKDAKTGTDGKLPYLDFAKHLVDAYQRPGSKKKSGKASGKKKGPSAAGSKKKK